MEKFILADIMCTFDLRYYPFDNQMCEVTLTNDKYEYEPFLFKQDFLIYSGPQSSGIYKIKDVRFKNTINKDSLIVQIVLDRDMMNILLTNTLPTLLIVIVSIGSTAFQMEKRCIYVIHFF